MLNQSDKASLMVCSGIPNIMFFAYYADLELMHYVLTRECTYQRIQESVHKVIKMCAAAMFTYYS
jgi:hypothetical protein